eukprot:scaffold291299_cov31-Tisochrysis_lutea.AAC.1
MMNTKYASLFVYSFDDENERYNYNYVNMQDNNGMTALMHAVLKGNVDAVDEIIDLGADVDKQDNGGMTALMHAVRICNVNVVNTLLSNGACVGDKVLNLARQMCEQCIRSINSSMEEDSESETF